LGHRVTEGVYLEPKTRRRMTKLGQVFGSGGKGRKKTHGALRKNAKGKKEKGQCPFTAESRPQKNNMF